MSVRFLFSVIISHLLLSSTTYALKPIKNYIKNPADYECRYDSVSVNTNDNMQLAGWYIYSKSDGSQKPVIIFSYGDAGNMSYFLDYANELSSNGYNVLLYDYRGFGHSHDFSLDEDMLIYKEFLLDLDAAVQYVKERYASEIVLFGHSMGATLSIGVADSRDDILAVVADGPYENTQKVLNRINLFQEKNNQSRRFKIEHLYPKDAEPENAIQNFRNTAFYTFTGSEDEVITADAVYRLYALCPSHFKSIWIAPGSDHGNIVRHQTLQYFHNIYSFLDLLVKK